MDARLRGAARERAGRGDAVTGTWKGSIGFVCAAALACAVSISVASSAARCGEGADSSMVFRWSALYRSSFDLKRSADGFPWNDEASLSHLNDRLAVLGEVDFGGRLSIFAKGATGLRLDWALQTEQFILDQGHVEFNGWGGAVRARAFSRERVFRVGRQLLRVLSDESPFVEGRGEGLTLRARAGSHFALEYIGSILEDSAAVGEHGGLPSFEGGEDALQTLRVEAGTGGRWYAGFMLSEIRSMPDGDFVAVGADLGIRIGRAGISAELARTQSGSWSDLREGSMFDVEPSAFGADGFSGVFSSHDAFSAEIEIPDVPLGGFGKVGIVPGYRFAGSEFLDPQGEVVPGEQESYCVAWWKSAQYDALASIEVSGGSGQEGDFRRLVASGRTRYRGGFELRERLLCSTGRRSSAIVSASNDNSRSRVSMLARLDDLGAGNEFSFATDGAINVGSRVTARNVLYLYRSRTSLYNVQIEFRPRERFLMMIAFGSFVPSFEGMLIGRAFDPDAPSNERFISLAARIWFGGVSAE
jgi:hypothetical protein